MRYAVFTDIHANLEAMKAVLEKIDELAKEKPIDAIWFLGDLVGYGPNPNECINELRKRTEVIIAGNHDWAAVGKIDLEDFSTAARISAEWTAEQLTEENKTFLTNLPERIEISECTLVHGSPYGPLWEYLTSEVLAERSFQHFSSRFCFVGHTHVPVIFQQADAIANAPTLPLVDEDEVKNGLPHHFSDAEEGAEEEDNAETDDTEETAELAVIKPSAHSTKLTIMAESAYADPATNKTVSEEEANALQEAHNKPSTETTETLETNTANASNEVARTDEDNAESVDRNGQEAENTDTLEDMDTDSQEAIKKVNNDEGILHEADSVDVMLSDESDESDESDGQEIPGIQVTPEAAIVNAEDRLNSEIEELLTLLGLSESMVQVTNEMILPPIGHWDAPLGIRAIINPGGVGQPRDGDPRAAFMIYDTEEGFEFYRIPYPFNKTQEKILKVGLPQYLAVRLAYGR